MTCAACGIHLASTEPFAGGRCFACWLTPAQRNGFAFWTSIVTALIEASEPVEEPA